VAKILVPEGDDDIGTGIGCLVIVDDEADVEGVKNMDFSAGLKEAVSEPTQAKEEQDKATKGGEDSDKATQSNEDNKATGVEDSQWKTSQKQNIKVLEQNWQETVFEFEGKTYSAEQEVLNYIMKNSYDIKP